MAAASGTLLRNLTDNKAPNPYTKCAYHALSDGTAVSVVADVGALYVYKHSTQDMNGSVTLAATIANDTAAGDSYIYSSAVDAANGIHVVWRAHNYTLSYAYYAYSGGGYPTQTLLKTGLLSGVSAQYAPVRVDIDCAGSGTHQYSVIAAYVNNSGQPQTSVNLVVIDDSANATYSNIFALGNGVSPVLGTPDITVSCEKNGSIGSVGYIKIAIAATRNWQNRNDSIADILQCFKFTTSNNTFSTGGTFGIPSQGMGNGQRKYCLFQAGNDTVFYLAGGTISGWYFAYTFTLDSSCNIVTRTAPSSRRIAHPNMQASGANFVGFNRYGEKIIIYSQSAYNVFELETITFSPGDGTTNWFDTPIQWHTAPSNMSPGCVIGGNSRTPVPGMGTLCYWNGRANNSYGVYYQAICTPRPPVQIAPTTNTKFTTGFPVLSARFKLAFDFAQVRYRMRWQLASDAAFSQSLQNYYSDLNVVANAGVTSNADIRATQTPDVAIPSGAWFMRAAEVDEFGNQGPWSTAVPFNVGTVPSASKLAPDNGFVAAYGTGTVMMSWKFSSSVSYATQSAYQVIVTRASDGAAVSDTGKVTSTANSANVVIPSAFKDVLLQWQLYVWDTENQQSVPFGPATFFASDAPVPAFTYPTNGSAISNGYPAVAWNPGLGGVKTQATYRVQLTQGKVMLYDSGVKASSNTTQQIPSGLLQNNSNYTLRLTVTDSLGQIGVTSIAFSTSYTAPAAVTSTTVFLYEFERKGFVFVGWTYTNLDQDFLQFNLYRQEIGAGPPVVVAQFVDYRTAYGYRDTAAKGNTRYRYWVTQVVNRYGDLVESAVGTQVTVNTGGTNYWLSDSAGLLDAVPLLLVTDDTWTDEHEEDVKNVIGRGRHVDIGTRWGVNGTLTCQLRDRQVGLTPGYNWCPNPSFALTSDGVTPSGWTFTSTQTSGSPGVRYDTFCEPLPSGRPNAIALAFDAIAASNAGYVIAASPMIPLSLTDIVAGGQCMLSVWQASDPLITNNPNATRLQVICYDSGGNVVQSNVQVATAYETYEPANSGDTNTGKWTRWGITLGLNANTVSVVLRIVYYNATTAALSGSVYFTGVMLHAGNQLLPYFDGDMIGGKWVDQQGGYSYNLGSYSAHDQRYAIKRLKETNRPLILRTPFGEAYQVSVGDDGNTRIAGVGARDFDDITIPYREIAF